MKVRIARVVQMYRPRTGGVLPVPPQVVVPAAGQGGVGEIHAQVVDLDRGHETTRPRMQPFGDHQQVGGHGRAVAQRHLDAVAVVVDPGDLGVEAVVGVGGGPFDEDAGQLSPQNLQFGGGTVVFAAGRDGKRGRRGAVGPDEAGADLAGVRRADRIVDTHPPGHFARGTADIDILPLVASGGVTLDHGGVPPAGAELVGQGWTGDAGTRDDGVRSHGRRILSVLGRNGTAASTDPDGVTSAEHAASEDFGVETRARQYTETCCLDTIVLEKVADGMG